MRYRADSDAPDEALDPAGSREIRSVRRTHALAYCTRRNAPCLNARGHKLEYRMLRYIKFIKNKPKTKGDTDLDDYDYGEDEEPTGEEDLHEDAEEEMDDEFPMDAEPEDEKL